MIGATQYAWSARSGRYFDARTGRFVSRDTIRLALDDVIADAEVRIRAASEQLRRGAIDLTEWQGVMREEIKSTMLTAEALATGGRRQLTQAEYGRVGAAVRTQYRYLDGFTQAIRDGLPLDGRFLNRAAMYARAARPFYHDEQVALLVETGYAEERNILHQAEHCGPCVDMSAIGWVAIGTLIPIGARDCLGNDRCTMRYR
jgi:hypothetical protein